MLCMLLSSWHDELYAYNWQTLARVVEATERHYKAAGRRSGLPLPAGPIEDRDYFRVWPKVNTC